MLGGDGAFEIGIVFVHNVYDLDLSLLLDFDLALLKILAAKVTSEIDRSFRLSG